MPLRNVVDVDEKTLSEESRAKIEKFVALGYKRAHLSINDEGTVFLDRELVENEAFEQVFYGHPSEDDEEE